MKIREIKDPIAIHLNIEPKMICAVIGDLHVKTKNMKESQELFDTCFKHISEAQVDFVVILGDILDSHEIVKIQPHNLIYNFIKRMYEANMKIFIIIGNHDYINNSQFHTEQHIFTAFKQWKDVYIVDSPTVAFMGDQSVVFTPYVFPGKFIESLNSLTSINEMWESSLCIFAHQEMKGCVLRKNVRSENGDAWDDGYPPIISGHIHTSQKVGKNIFYVGSPANHSPLYTEDKFIWIVDFNTKDTENEGYPYFNIRRIGTDVARKSKTYKNLKALRKSVNAYDGSVCKVHTTPEEFKQFKKSELYTTISKRKITISPIYEEKSIPNKKLHETFDEVLTRMMDEEDEDTKKLFEKVCLQSS